MRNLAVQAEPLGIGSFGGGDFVTNVAIGFLASLLAGLMTGVGALPAMLGRSVSQRANDILLGFAAGVMLAASFFSLIVPGIEAAREMHGGRIFPAAIAAAGIFIGVAAMAILNERIPHEHFFQGRQGPQSDALARMPANLDVGFVNMPLACDGALASVEALKQQ